MPPRRSRGWIGAPGAVRGAAAGPQTLAFWTGLGAALAAMLVVLALALVPRSDGQAFFDDGSDLLDPDDAFALSYERQGEDLVLTWTIADGYYMYREQFEFAPETDGLELGEPVIPDGTVKEDEFFGVVETYRHEVTLTLPILRAEAGDIEITARSQGCADIGVCYPPHFQPVRVTLDAPIDRPAPAAATDATPRDEGGLAGLSNFSRDVGDATGTGVDDLLEPEVAFAASAEAISQNAVLIRFEIADGYYLYRDSLDFRVSDDAGARVATGPINFPDGQLIEDEFFGESVVYREHAEIFVPILRDEGSARSVSIDIDYQGCADIGICYPPLTQTVEVTFTSDLAETAEAPAGDAQPRAPPATSAAQPPAERDLSGLPVSEQDRIAAQLADGRVWLTILAFFGFGLLLTFTPCVFPMIPILSNIIIGQKNLTTPKAFSISLVFVLAMAATYTAAGVFAGLAGANLQAAFQNPWIIGTFVAIFVLLALSMFGFYELQMPSAVQSKLSQISNRQEGGTYIGAGVMGFLSALIVGPCVTAPLIGALLYISQTGDALLGGLALFSLSMGMGVPLLIIGTSAGKLLPKAGPWMDAIKAVFGVGLLAMGIWLLDRVIPGEITLLLWGVLLTVSAIYMGALTQLPDGVSGWRKLWKGLGLVILVYGVVLLIGAASGAKDPLRPFEGLQTAAVTMTADGAAPAVAQEPAWHFVNTVDEFEAELARARDAGRPVFFQFTADWCIDCQRMERNTFRDPQVRAALTQMHLVKADVTDNDAGHRELLRHFNLFGPPAYVFYDERGDEVRPMRAIGYIPSERFLALLDQGLGLRP